MSVVSDILQLRVDFKILKMFAAVLRAEPNHEHFIFHRNHSILKMIARPTCNTLAGHQGAAGHRLGITALSLKKKEKKKTNKMIDAEFRSDFMDLV